MSKKLTFTKCNEKDWKNILNKSNQSTLFCENFFLKNCGSKYHLWKVTEGKEIKAGVCLNVDDSEKNSIENDLIIHNGIFFNLDKNRILPKIREDQFQITTFIINNITEKYEKIFLSLDPSFQDLRPFQWFNYGLDKPKFEIEIKYTSILNLNEMRFNLSDENLKIFKNLEPVRRYSIRQALKEKFKVEFLESENSFLMLYEKFLQKNDPKNNKKKFEILSKIVKNIIKEKRGIISNVYDNSNNLIYSNVIGWDYHKAYYLYGVGSETNKKSWQGTIGQWSVFRYITNNTNLNNYDFEGVNSPNRGWFKLGFGGDLTSYYQIKYEKKRKVYSNK